MEETRTPKIVDQALAHPIKYTLMLTKEVFVLNKGLLLGFAAIITLFAFLSAIPIIGFLPSILSGVLMFALQIFVGKTFYQANTMDEFVNKIRSATLMDIWNKYWKPATGAYLGWAGVMLILIIISGLIISITGNVDSLVAATSSGDLTVLFAALPGMIIPLMLFAMIFYVSPLVMANIFKAENFNDAFMAVFTLFSAEVWRRAFNVNYFNYITLLGLVLIGLAVIVFIIVYAIMFILASIGPSMVLVGTMIALIISMVVQVVVTILFAISAVIADRMTR